MKKMEMKRQYLYVVAICLSIILSAAIIAYRPQPSQLKDFRFVTGIPNARGATSLGQTVQLGTDQVKTISLTGYGSASAQANEATLTVGVQTEGPDASGAVEENARSMVAVINSIKELGFSDDELKTVSYGVSPIYDNDWNRVTGYRVVNMIQVEISNLDLVGDVIDAASGAGANRINGVSFGLSEDVAENLKLDAYREALNDAATKAEVIAETLAIELTGVYSVSENVYYPIRPYAVAEGISYDRAPTPIIEGSLSVSVTVQIVYTFQ